MCLLLKSYLLYSFADEEGPLNVINCSAGCEKRSEGSRSEVRAVKLRQDGAAFQRPSVFHLVPGDFGGGDHLVRDDGSLGQDGGE